MEQAAARTAGWIIDTREAWVFVAGWAVVVLVYGFWRSRGEARQDTIRPSGPTE